MDRYARIPKYIEKKLEQASEYSKKQDDCIKEFEQWVVNNVDANFDFDVLRAMYHANTHEEMCNQTEALTEVEVGGDVDVDALERAINYFKGKFA